MGYVLKPLTTIAILVIALTRPAVPSASYRALISAGLACSLAGDVLLMLPADLFTQGLAAFLLAHLCYIRAFVTHGGKQAPRWWLLPLGVFGLGMLALLRPGVGRLLVPVACYVAVILVMFWQAAGRWHALRSRGAALAAAGAGSFLVSDGVLALDRFRAPVPSASTLVLGTYYLAQLLIALSVGHPDPARKG